MLLFSTVKEILSKEGNAMIYKPSIRYLLNQAKRNLEKIIEENDNQEGSANKKTKSHAKEGLLSIEQIQKDLEDNNTNEERSNTTNQYTIEDAEFIESLSKPVKNRNWKDIFDKGKERGLFKSYKSSDSLKSSYYHIQRRKKQKE